MVEMMMNSPVFIIMTLLDNKGMFELKTDVAYTRTYSELMELLTQCIVGRQSYSRRVFWPLRDRVILRGLNLSI